MRTPAQLFPLVALVGLLTLAACGGEEIDEAIPMDELEAVEEALWPATPVESWWKTPPDVVRRSLVDLLLAANAPGGPQAGNLDTLIAALRRSGLDVVRLLMLRGQFTLLAPTDVGFAELGITPRNVAALDSRLLADVLRYHMLRGRRLAESVLEANKVPMLKGGFVYPTFNGVITDNLGRSARVVETDLPASNGMLHVVNRVLLPYRP